MLTPVRVRQRVEPLPHRRALRQRTCQVVWDVDDARLCVELDGHGDGLPELETRGLQISLRNPMYDRPPYTAMVVRNVTPLTVTFTFGLARP